MSGKLARRAIGLLPFKFNECQRFQRLTDKILGGKHCAYANDSRVYSVGPEVNE